MDTTTLISRLEAASSSFHNLERQLADPDVAADPQRLETIARERSRLEPLVLDYTSLQKVEAEQVQAKSLLKESRGDAAMEELAQQELQELDRQHADLVQRITVALLPKDPRDERSVMLEIRAGAGGDEACLWAGDLARMYERFSSRRGWNVKPVSASEADLGGYKELILSVKGDAVFSELKFEAGVHRVQRVPSTESQGRVHTSTATGAEKPEAGPGEAQTDASVQPRALLSTASASAPPESPPRRAPVPTPRACRARRLSPWPKHAPTAPRIEEEQRRSSREAASSSWIRAARLLPLLPKPMLLDQA